MLASAARRRMRIEIPNLEAGQRSRRERERVSLSGCARLRCNGDTPAGSRPLPRQGGNFFWEPESTV